MLQLPVWGCRQGYASFLSLEFGKPKLIVNEYSSKERGLRRQAHAEGEWHVWIYCCEWRFCNQNEQIAHGESERHEIERAMAILNGQKLTEVRADPVRGAAAFHFDLGGVLDTWPVGDNPAEEQWFIYSPDLVFAYRADGQFTINAPNVAPSEYRWTRLG